MPGVAPETSSDKAPPCIIACPVQPCAWPLRSGIIRFRILSVPFLQSQDKVFVAVEGELLIVGSELDC